MQLYYKDNAILVQKRFFNTMYTCEVLNKRLTKKKVTFIFFTGIHFFNKNVSGLI